MKTWLLPLVLLASGCGGCVGFPTADSIRPYALRLEFAHGICSGTAIAPHVLATASHCLADDTLVKVNDHPVTVIRVLDDGHDHSIVVVDRTFTHYAPRVGVPHVGDRVRWWGQPMGEPFVYREGYIAEVTDEVLMIDAPICHGDSGSGVFNDKGERVGIISAMSNEYGCTFMVVRK